MTQPHFPSVLSKWKKGFRLKKVSALATPEADYLAVYYDSADSKLKIKNENGTVKILSDALVSPISVSDITELTGLTASATELNILDGATLSTTELNYVDGATGNLQNQINAIGGGAFLISASTSQTYLAGTTYYQWLFGALGFVTTEAGYKASMPFAFTWSNIRVLVLSNNATANGTVKSRKNETNGNQNVVITALTTGEFTDAVNTDSIIVGDDINYQINIGTGGNTQVLSISSKGVPA